LALHILEMPSRHAKDGRTDAAAGDSSASRGFHAFGEANPGLPLGLVKISGV